MDWRAPVSKTGIWASVVATMLSAFATSRPLIEPDLVELAGDIGRVLLNLQVIARGDDLLLVAAKLHVVEGYLGGKAHLDIPQVLDGSLDVRARRLHIPADTAEKVELPCRVETGLVQVARTPVGSIEEPDCR